MKKVGMVSLGCAKNLVDSEVMLGELVREGYALTPDADDAEVIIVNTCGFIDKAKEESISTIFEMAELKKTGKLKKLIVSGCLSQRYHAEMAAEMPEVDLFLGTGQVGDIRQFLGEGSKQPESWQPDFLYSSQNQRVLTTPSHSAYVKISEGCDHVCAFCIIPALRGKHRSRSIEDIGCEVAQLAESGVREVNLVAQDSTYYGRDIGLKDGLAQLLEHLAETPGIDWIRVHYMYPFQVSTRLLEAIAGHPKICNYLDIPLQHADKDVLAAMRRGGSRPQLERFLQKIRKVLPEAFVRSSFIVGYPGEDARAFRELCEFVMDMRFNYVGIFTYSHEEGTTAHPLGDPVPEDVKNARRDELAAIQKDISKQHLAQLVGKTLPVMVEGVHPETELLLRGRHMGQAPGVDGEVMITEGTFRPGDLIPVTIEESFDYDVAGRVLQGVEV